jgi:tetratricopeptide (TPR) repeat protein
LAAQAATAGVTIAAPASMKTMLSRWENGSGRPDAVYQGLLCRVFDCEPVDLGFGPEPGRLAVARVTPIADSETVDYFRTVLHQHIRADNLIGPHHLIEPVTAQAALLDRTLTDLPRGRVREELLRLAYQYHELAGWLLQDAGDPGRAMAMSDRAMERTMVLDDRPSTVYILTRKSNIASDQGNPDRAVSIAEAAVRLMDGTSPQMRAIVLSHQARAQALRGSAGASARSMESAAEEINRHDGAPDPLAAYVTPEYVAMEQAACWLTLGRSDRAIPIFHKALATWPAPHRRDLGLCQARLATAYADQGEADTAVEVAAQAVQTIRVATSARAVRQLDAVRAKLASKARNNAQVADLRAMINSLRRAA